MQKRKTDLKSDGGPLTIKSVEEMLAEIKKKKSTTRDVVASAGKKFLVLLEPQVVEREDDDLPQEDLEDEEEDAGDDPSEDAEIDDGDARRCHVTYGYHLVRGKMKHGMEDYVVAKTQHISGNEVGLYAKFDGHSGKYVAEYLQNHLFENILSEDNFWTDPETAVKKAYKATDEEILDRVVGSRGGSTAVTAMLINRDKLLVAKVGDSRGILCKRRAVEQVTVDHEPEKEDEKEHVEIKGGCNIPRVDGQLAMTRAFGDGKLKDHITSEPDVRVEHIDEDAKFIVLASDVVWKVMSNEDVCDCIKDLDDAQEAAEMVVKEALSRKSQDDISCVVVLFH
ncbi:hypothetical protein Droror1_Dr00010063 [Drosera rotundifolia]